MIIDGKSIAEEIKAQIKNEASKLKNRGITPGLAVIMVGEDPASKIYVNNKKKACEETGIYSQEYFLSQNTSQEELINLIEKLNLNHDINGILVQLPLPPSIDENAVAESIDPKKDVDVFNPANTGKVMIGNAKLLPCTPAGIIEILDHEKISVDGKNCVVVGRSNIVGKPTALLLLQKNGTVTVCHSKTKNLKEICQNADIIISAVGKPCFITKDMVKKEAVVIDVGINRRQDGTICGDVDFENVAPLASYITPVPGGVGPMTISMLMKNTLIAAKLQNNI